MQINKLLGGLKNPKKVAAEKDVNGDAGQVPKASGGFSEKLGGKAGSSLAAHSNKPGHEVPGNWYSDRYHVAILQRNVLLIAFFVSVAAIMVSVLVVVYINSSHVIEPFIIEVEKKTGVATLVDTAGVKRFSANKAVNDYFLVQYINARELFDPNNYAYNWYSLVRLFSNGDVYRKFLASANAENEEYAYLNTTNAKLKIRSIQYLSEASVQIRFAIETSGQQAKVYGKVALITFTYNDASLTKEQRYVNPLGFLITSYRVTDELEQ